MKEKAKESCSFVIIRPYKKNSKFSPQSHASFFVKLVSPDNLKFFSISFLFAETNNYPFVFLPDVVEYEFCVDCGWKNKVIKWLHMLSLYILHALNVD